ncbi:hypothetical protein M2407_005139 [Serratia sp. BIGb0234]|uniref:hypothetical protein n=1 Tax=Serratia sp. BIGb0234 TaxID=2940614 RepID=UPI002168AC9C|nr:hypothetical protein [Serratia sp. BIGb0234]MCS4320765.1 hypothetical protein [Serratia sp. BIGb0234]
MTTTIRQKEVSPALIEQEIEQSNVDWYELVKEARVRKFGGALPTGPMEKIDKSDIFSTRDMRWIRYLKHQVNHFCKFWLCSTGGANGMVIK